MTTDNSTDNIEARFQKSREVYKHERAKLETLIERGQDGPEGWTLSDMPADWNLKGLGDSAGVFGGLAGLRLERATGEPLP